jgi:RNA polymerase sigma factor (sigma-70 family)
MLVRYVASTFRTLSTEDAQDVVQDVFLEIQKKSPQVREGAESLYLRTAVRRRALNVLRARAAHQRNVSEVPERAPQPGIDDELIRRESTADAQARAGAAIQALPEVTRQCFLLRLHGRSGADIARVVNLSEVAVRSRLNDAKNRLRAMVGELPDWIDWPELAEGNES